MGGGAASAGSTTDSQTPKRHAVRGRHKPLFLLRSHPSGVGENQRLDAFTGGGSPAGESGEPAASGEDQSGSEEPADPGSGERDDDGGERASDGGPGSAASADSEQSGRAAPDGAGVEPPAVTSSVTPGGAPCAACGETVRRRFAVDGGDLVCRSCAAWRE